MAWVKVRALGTSDTSREVRVQIRRTVQGLQTPVLTKSIVQCVRTWPTGQGGGDLPVRTNAGSNPAVRTKGNFTDPTGSEERG